MLKAQIIVFFKSVMISNRLMWRRFHFETCIICITNCHQQHYAWHTIAKDALTITEQKKELDCTTPSLLFSINPLLKCGRVCFIRSAA